MNELKKVLGRIKNKILFQQFIDYFMISIGIELILDFIVILISKYKYINRIFYSMLFIHLIGFIILLIVFLIRRKSLNDIVKIVDSLGFKERFITAFQISKKDNKNQFEKLAFQDALTVAKQTDFNKLYNLKINKKLLLSCIISLIICFVGYIAPSPFIDKLEEERLIQSELEKASERAKILNDRLNEDNQNFKEKQQIFNELENNLKKANNIEKAEEKIKDSQLKLMDTLKSDKENLEKVSQSLKENQLTAGLGQSIQNLDADDVNTEINKIKDKVQNSSNLLDEVISSLDNSVENIADVSDSDLKEVLETTSKNLKSSDGDLQKADKEFENLKQAISDNIRKVNSEVDENNKLNNELNKMLENITGNENETGLLSNNKNGNENGFDVNSENYNGHIENQNNDDYSDINRNVTDEKLNSKEIDNGEMNSEKKIYLSGDTEGKINYQQKLEEYKNSALSSAESQNYSAKEKELIKKYFSD